VVSVLDSGTDGPGFKSQSRRCRVTVLGKLFAPIVPLFTKQRNQLTTVSRVRLNLGGSHDLGGGLCFPAQRRTATG